MSFRDDVSSSSFTPVTSSKLKGRIKAIKDGQLCNGASSVSGQLESYTVAQLRLEHERVERAHRERIEELKSHLAGVIDRTTRIRTAYDKEKRQLLNQLEKLACEHRQAEASWEARLSRASESHAQALSARDRDIRILRQQYDEAMQLAEHCKADLCAQRLQVEDRFRCDLKRKEQDHAAALRHAQSQRAEISAELELARQQSQENGKKVEAGEKHVEALSVQLKTLTQELKESRHLEQAAQNEVKVCAERLNREQQKHRQDMDDASAAADAQMLELQESRSREMDEIDGKLKDVLQRKNATIQRLQKSLDEANTRIAVYEEEMHREKIRVLEQMKW